MKNFKEKVYLISKKIPFGKVATYSQISKLAGNAKASRAVGMLMKNNPDKNTIPCHRVVSSTGKLTGYAFGRGISTKKALLLKEGVLFKKDAVDLEKSNWNK